MTVTRTPPHVRFSDGIAPKRPSTGRPRGKKAKSDGLDSLVETATHIQLQTQCALMTASLKAVLKAEKICSNGKPYRNMSDPNIRARTMRAYRALSYKLEH